jgi:hypothetical protein
MRRTILCCAAAWLALSAPSIAWAEIKVVWERNETAAATGEFKFKNVLSPSKTDAAVNAKFSIVAGRADPNGGGVDVLHDGRVPAEADQPDDNFFFAAGTQGGRLLVDLGEPCDVQQVNTYSWHPSTRAPQVYRLYAHDGSAGDFKIPSARDTDLEPSGWKRIASVDTRPAGGVPGGQYGVSVSDASGALGKYRYLLFEITRTEAADPFGNTFFSEIDVCDGRQHIPAPGKVSLAANGKYEIVFDTSEVPELQNWVDGKLRPVCEQWYPRIVELLPSDGYTAPRRVTVTFKQDMSGVAATSGTRITCADGWFRRNVDGEAAGAVVHELVHVVQQYGRTRGGHRNPGWLVEGIADYLRWFQYEPPSLRPRPDPARAKYTDSYRTTAAFLNYVTETRDQAIVQKLNTALREGKYTEELWKASTGKTVDELWADYLQTLRD